MAQAVRSVLVVDDHHAVRDAVRSALVKHGYAALVAADGAEALRMLDRGVLPDVIILDLMMPKMNGFEFLMALRSRSNLGPVPVVVLSVSRSYTADDLGVRSVLRKPCELSELLSAVARSCSPAAAT